MIFSRGVYDVGFSTFADTDADFAFQYPQISDADVIYFIILGLSKSVAATDDEENSENYAIIKLIQWNYIKKTYLNRVIYSIKRKTYSNKIIHFIEINNFKNS